MRRESLGAYARRIERALERLREAPVVLSPRDWRLISEWHRRELPLALVLETLEEVARSREKRRRPQGPRSLAAVAAAVEEAARVWREGRAGAGAAGTGSGVPPLEEVRGAWAAAAAAAGGSPLAELIETLLAELEGGADPAGLDRRLDERLPGIAPPEVVRRVREAARRDLEPHRRRMTAAAFERTAERALADGLRAALGLPRLALAAR